MSEPVQVSIGGQLVTVKPLKGLARVAAASKAARQEVAALKERIARVGKPLAGEVDIVRLLRLWLPDVITDELLEQSTAHEREELLVACAAVNPLVEGMEWTDADE